MRAWFFAGLCWLYASMASAATYYVQPAPTGNDSRSCATSQTIGTPRATVNAGVACLTTAGDILLVRAGTYAEALSNNVTSGSNFTTGLIHIAAYPSETVWLQPSVADNVISFTGSQAYIEFDRINLRAAQSGCVVYLGLSTHHIRIQNAEVVNDNGPGFAGQLCINSTSGEFVNLTVHGHGGPYAFYVSGDSNLVSDCDVYGTSYAGIHVYSSSRSPTSNIIRNCHVHDITESAFFGGIDTRIAGIILSGSTNQAFDNIVDHVALAGRASTESASGGILVTGGSGNKIWNNTITANVTHGIRIDSGVLSTDVTNNISYNNTGNADTGAPYQNLSDGGSGTTTTTNLLGTNPSFVSTTDFHLAAGSVAIDGGTTLASVTVDFDDVTRPQGNAYDIGAYEYGGIPQPPNPPPTTEIQKYKIRFRKP